MSRNWRRHVPLPIKIIYRRARLMLRVVAVFDAASLAHWRTSVSLGWLLYRIGEDSLISPAWLRQLHGFVGTLQAEGIGGALVECGVYHGGSAAVLAHAMHGQQRKLWLFDSFQGLPKPVAADGPDAPALEGKIVGDVANVWRLQRLAGAGKESTHVVTGWFSDTFSQQHVGSIALLHIDADWYESVLLCLEYFYDDLADGAFVVLDDYNEWFGCNRAVEDFARARGLDLKVLGGGEAMPYYFRKNR